MKSSIGASLVLLSVFLSTTAETINCDGRYSYEKCTIQKRDFSFAPPETLNFPVFANFEFRDCTASYLSPEIMKRMRWINTISIVGGIVSKIYVSPDLFSLSVESSETKEIVINDDGNCSLTELNVISNYLNAIPANVNQLKELTKLNLKSNEIQYVNFSDFTGLSQLKEINLASNKLYAMVSDGNVELDKLESLDLSNNLLVELDFNNWKLPVLQTLSVNGNSLRVIKHFDENTFPLLSTFHHSDNVWDCRWSKTVTSAVTKIQERKDLDYGYGHRWSANPLELECSKFTQLSASVYRQLNLTANDDAQFKLDSPEEVEEELRTIVEDTTNNSADIKELKQTASAQQSQIAKLLEQIHEQQTLLESLSSQVQTLEKQLQSSVLPDGTSIPKSFAEKLIMEVSYVIRKNVRDDLGVA